ncbi:MAG TPA: hypothetical protein VMH49_05860 [Thermoplasmata archaeon]|nr:hypothetical protein [Thermoplasmata archaeon]
MTDLGVIAVLAGLATGMTLISSVAVKWAAFAESPLRASVVQFLLLMMAGMFLGVLVYYAVGGGRGVVEGLWVASAVMSASVLLVFVGFFRQLRAGPVGGGGPAAAVARRGFVVSVVGLVILNELLMGWSFSLLSGQLAPGLGSRGDDVARLLDFAVTSPWFVFPMALEMVLTVRWLGAALPRRMLPYLWVQPVIMVCSPPTLVGAAWVVGTAVVASGLMALVVGLVLRDAMRVEEAAGAVGTYLAALLASLGAMAGGLVLWVDHGGLDIFALALVLQMAVFLFAVTDPGHFRPVPLAGRSPQERGPAGGVPGPR